MTKASLKTKHPSTATKANPPSPAQPSGDAAITTAEQRQRLIAEAAYYLAESRGFQGGDPAQDWLQAEAAIDLKLKKGAMH